MHLRSQSFEVALWRGQSSSFAAFAAVVLRRCGTGVWYKYRSRSNDIMIIRVKLCYYFSGKLLMIQHFTFVGSHAGSGYMSQDFGDPKLWPTQGWNFDQLKGEKNMGQPVSHMHAYDISWVNIFWATSIFGKYPGWYDCIVIVVIWSHAWRYVSSWAYKLISSINETYAFYLLYPFISSCPPLSAGVNLNVPATLEGHYDDVASGALWQKYACMHACTWDYPVDYFSDLESSWYAAGKSLSKNKGLTNFWHCWI